MSTGSERRSRTPFRGEIWLYDPNPVRGREHANARPAIIVSNDEFNQSIRGLVAIVPMTRTRRAFEEYPYHVEVQPEFSGLQHPRVAMCEQIRAISVERLLGGQPRGYLHRSKMDQVEDRLRIVLGL